MPKFSFIRGAPQAHGVSYVNRTASSIHDLQNRAANFHSFVGAPQARVVSSVNSDQLRTTNDHWLALRVPQGSTFVLRRWSFAFGHFHLGGLVHNLTALFPGSIISTSCGCSSVGRAFASQAKCHGFESRYPLSKGRSRRWSGFFLWSGHFFRSGRRGQPTGIGIKGPGQGLQKGQELGLFLIC